MRDKNEISVIGQRDPRTYAVIGAAIEVHRVLGPGFLDAVYEEAFAGELRERDVPFVAQKPLAVTYKTHVLVQTYRADFVCFDEVLVEIKALKTISDIERAQIIHYLKVTGLNTGLLIDVGAPSLPFERCKNCSNRWNHRLHGLHRLLLPGEGNQSFRRRQENVSGYSQVNAFRSTATVAEMCRTRQGQIS